jgi:Undecaprenyl-phosphate galactose phosphotransferase WbaP
MATVLQSAPIQATLIKVRTNPFASGLVMLFTDLVALSVSGYIGSQLWMALQRHRVPPIYNDLWPALALFLVIFALENLYPGVGVGPVEMLRKLIRGSSIVYLMLTTALFLSKGADLQSRGAFFTSWLLTIVLLPLCRAIMHHYVAGKEWFGVPVVILGTGPTASLLIEKLRSVPELCMKPVACLDDSTEASRCVDDVPIAGHIADVARIARSLHVRHAFLAIPELSQDELLRLLERCSVVFPHVFLVPNLSGVASIPVSPMDVDGVLALELRHNLLFSVNRYSKRLMDLVMVLALAPVAIPIILVAAAWICLVSRGNPFYWQEREGEGAMPIRILKLRTMYPNADALLADHLDRHPAARAHWDRYLKLRDDPRILPGVGHFLRRSSLDELPQIWNVFKGEMSMVGPRPFPIYHVEQFKPAFRDLRTKVRPGLTGLWQISARSEGDLDVQTNLDTYYIRNWSLWLDIFILSRTARAVILGQGAY